MEPLQRRRRRVARPRPGASSRRRSVRLAGGPGIALLVACAPLLGAPAGATSSASCSAGTSIGFLPLSSLSSLVSDTGNDAGATGCSTLASNGIAHGYDAGLVLVTEDGQNLVGTPTDHFEVSSQTLADVSGSLGTFHGHASANVSMNEAWFGYAGVQVSQSSQSLDGVALDSPLAPLEVGGIVPGSPVGSILDVNPLGGGSGGGARVEWIDSITLVAPNAQPGTPILLRVAAPLAAAVAASPCGTAPLAANSLATTNFAVYDGNALLGAAGTAIGTCNSASYASGPVSFSAPVGSVLALHGTFTVSASADIDNGGASGASYAQASVDAGQTAHFYVDVLTPGASYVSDSGITYATPVPEPAAGVISAGGVAALSWIARRRGV